MTILSYKSLSQENIANLYLQGSQASSLISSVEVPVSHFTGIANYPIDLHTLVEGDISVPIGLNYYASGVKIDEHPGWTGLNWNLQAGGSITRVVADLPDDYNVHHVIKKHDFSVLYPFFYYSERADQAGYFWNSSELSGSNWASASYIEEMVEEFKDAKDTEPDKFIFSFNGVSGEFYLSQNGDWKVKSEHDIRVEFNETFVTYPNKLQNVPGVLCMYEQGGQQLTSFSGFTLITSDGYKYHFGIESGSIVNDDALAAIEYSMPFYWSQVKPPVATTWKLSRIESPTGRNVYFTYQRKNYTADFHMAFDFTTNLYYDSGSPKNCSTIFGPSESFGDGQEETAVDFINPRYSSIDGSLVYPSYLKEINGSLEKITFQITETNELSFPKDMIKKNHHLQDKIYNYTPHQSVCKNNYPYLRYNFWPYLFGGNPQSPSYENLDTQLNRLKWFQLSQILIESKISNVKKSFNLNYTSNSDSRLFLKNIFEESNAGLIGLNYGFEYYGESSSTLLPEYISENIDHWGFLDGNNGGPCLTAKRISGHDFGLCSIDNPDFRTPAKNITDAQLGSLKKVTIPTGGSVGFTYEQNTYLKKLDEDREGVETLATDAISGGIRIKKIEYRDSDNGLLNSKEYSYKTENKSSGILDGNVKYEFSNVQFDTFGSDKIVRNHLSAFDYSPRSITYTGPHIGYSRITEILSDGSSKIYSYSNFDTESYHFDYEYLPSTGNEFSPYQPVNSKHIERGRLTKEEFYDSTNKLLLSKSYSYEATSTNYIRGIRLNARNFLCDNNEYVAYAAHPYKIYVYKYNIDVTTTKNYSQENNTFTEVENDYDYVGGDNSFVRKIKTTHSDDVETSIKYRYPFDISDHLVSRSMSHSLNNLLNYPIEEISYKDSKVTSSKVTLYSCFNCNYTSSYGGIYLNGFFRPIKSYKLELDEPLSDYTEVSDVFSIDARHKTLIDYDKYDDYGNLLQYHGTDDVNHSYIWGYDDTYPVAKIVGATHEDIEDVTGFGEDFTLGSGGLNSTKRASLRNELSDAHVTTYSYEPLIGMTNMWDPNGQKTAYVYDDLNRLKMVKDDNGDIVERYRYNYSSEADAMSANYTIDGCEKPGEELTFSATLYYEPTTYIWDFGDGTILEGTDSEVDYTYPDNGTYTYTTSLTILNPEYETVNQTKTVSLTPNIGSATVCGPYIYNPCFQSGSGNCRPEVNDSSIPYQLSVSTFESVTYQWKYRARYNGVWQGWYTFGSNSRDANLTHSSFMNSNATVIAEAVEVKCEIFPSCGDTRVSDTKFTTISPSGCN